MIFLKQSTAANVPIGPLVDTDGAVVTTATVAQADVRLSKNGAAFAQKGSSSDAAHMENGWYQLDLTSDDTATLGNLTITVVDTDAMQAWREFMIVPANVYDALIADTDYLTVDVVQIEGADATDTIASSAFDSDDAASVADHVWDELTTDHVGAGSFGLNLDVAISTAVFDSDDSAAIADHVWDELTTDHTGAGSFGLNLDVAVSTAVFDSDDAASVADHVWDELSTDHTGAGSFGLNLDAAVSTAVFDTDDVNAIWTEVVEGTLTYQQLQRICLAALGGKSSGGGTTTIAFRDVADGKDRISATVDSDGNRTAITVDGS